MAKSSKREKLVTLVVITLSLGLSACVTSPSALFQQQSSALGLTEASIKTSLFELAIFENKVLSNNAILHVYLEGDGVPFIQNRFVNSDPTSTKATTLSLIKQDPTNSVLIGRPCYHGKNSTPCSDSKWWTSHRYSTEVVNAMASAINTYNTEGNQVVLIGFSGGGALAMLMANQIKNIEKIITISANLDTLAWTSYHAYSPLLGSLNPISYLESNQGIKQLHLLGERDKNVPHRLWSDKLIGANSNIISHPEFTHHCCWSSIWPKVLSSIPGT